MMDGQQEGSAQVSQVYSRSGGLDTGSMTSLYYRDTYMRVVQEEGDGTGQ